MRTIQSRKASIKPASSMAYEPLDRSVDTMSACFRSVRGSLMFARSPTTSFPVTTAGVKMGLLLLGTILISALPTPTHAQGAASIHSRCEANFLDLSRGVVIYALIFNIISYPVYFGSLILLIKRKDTYPVNQRGKVFLLFYAVSLTVGNMIFGFIALTYPDCVPCGIFVLCQYFLLLPVCSTFLLRAVVLVFRIEILNFLVEKRWREEKKSLMEQYGISDVAVASNSGIDDAVAVPIASKSDENEHDILQSIPGYWYITHRRIVETKYLISIAAAIYLVVGIIVLLASIFDPDVGWTNDVLRSKGMPILAFGSQFNSNNFFSGPTCLAYSLKQSLVLTCFSAAMVPILVFGAWRIIVDKQRKRRREEEKQALNKRMNIKQDEPVNPVGLPAEPFGLDDMNAVKTEMGFVACLAFFGVGNYQVLEYFFEDFGVQNENTLLFVSFLVTVVWPLYISISIARKHKEMVEGKASKNSATHISERPAHHNPYYSLKYITNHPHTHAILLNFLQTEYSSENLLFITEVKAFEKACKTLEQICKHWPNKYNNQYNDSDSSSMVPPKASPRARGGEGVLSKKRLSGVKNASTHQVSDITSNAQSSADTAVESLQLSAEISPSASSVHPPTNSEHHAEAVRLKQWAESISDKYLVRSSMYEINIPEDLHRMIQSQSGQLDAWNPELPHSHAGFEHLPHPPPFALSMMYHQTQLEIFELIQKDSFRRFVLTQAFKELLVKADAMELEKLEKGGGEVVEMAAVVNELNVIDKLMEQQLSVAKNHSKRRSGENSSMPNSVAGSKENSMHIPQKSSWTSAATSASGANSKRSTGVGLRLTSQQLPGLITEEEQFPPPEADLPVEDVTSLVHMNSPPQTAPVSPTHGPGS